MNRGARIALFVFAALMVIFGAAEIATGFRHKFFGLSTDLTTISTIGESLSGLCTQQAGCSSVMRKWAAIVAVIFLVAVVVGRFALILTGLYPLGGFRQDFAIILGTSIACFFAIFVGLQVKKLG